MERSEEIIRSINRWESEGLAEVPLAADAALRNTSVSLAAAERVVNDVGIRLVDAGLTAHRAGITRIW